MGNQRQQLRFHTDPGHAWLEVHRMQLKNLGILGKISEFSYQRNEMVYLEEDCDADVFLRALLERGKPYKVIELSQRESLPVRTFRPFKVRKNERRHVDGS